MFYLAKLFFYTTPERVWLKYFIVRRIKICLLLQKIRDVNKRRDSKPLKLEADGPVAPSGSKNGIEDEFQKLPIDEHFLYNI